MAAVLCGKPVPAGKVKDWIEHACKYLSSEKILYGGEGTLPSDILNTDISDQEKENILWNNAAKLYKTVTSAQDRHGEYLWRSAAKWRYKYVYSGLLWRHKHMGL